MEKIKSLFETTEKTFSEIAKECHTSYKVVWKYIHSSFTEDQIAERKSRTYANSKLGLKNPMYGKIKEQHHNYIGDVSDGKGYLMRLKPEWYTGRKGCKHVFTHHIIICEHLGLTEIPSGFCVHHIDGNKLNNDLCNLALMTIQAHMRLHQLERATTIPKGSRVQENSKREAAIV